MLFKGDKRNARQKEHAPKQHLAPYKLASYEHDHEGKKLRSGKVVFSFWSASKYVLILSLMLWWLPMFGQMIAGYVGGRRAGGPWKGVAAAILPVVCLYAVVSGFENGILPSHLFGVAIAPAAIGAALNTNIPLISPYLAFSSDYVGAFVSALEGASPYGINTYVLTVAFAYIGGVLAEQSRREIEYSSGAVTSSTTVLVHDPYAQQRAELQVQEQPAGIGGVFAGITGLLHRPSRAEPGAYMSAHHRHRDPWAYAADMRYGEDEPQYDDQYSLPPIDQMQMRDNYDYGAYRTRHHKHHSRNDWNHKQKRRGRPNFSAKPRFRYQQYENHQQAQSQSNDYSAGWRRQSRPNPKYSVSTDPRSIRRTRKLIDNEWSGRKRNTTYSGYVEQSSGAADDVPAEHPHKKEHGQSHNWDSI